MKVSILILALALPALTAMAAAPAPAVAAPGVAANQTPPAIPKAVAERLSIFDPSAPGARDPFYPRSAPVAPKIAQRQPTAGQTPRDTFAQLRLRGLVANRLAVINGRTFGPNEEATVTLDAGDVARIRVHEITDKGVTITVSGETEKRVLRSLGSQK